MVKQIEEEEAFPRSRKGAESQKAANDGPPDLETSGSNKTRKKKARDDAQDEAEAPDSLGQKARHATRLRANDLPQGTLLVAAVRDVQDEELTLNLPYNVPGHVPRAHATEVAMGEQLGKLSDAYRPGQLVMAVVTTVIEAGQKRRVECSLRPSLANAGLEAQGVLPHMWLTAVVDGEEEHVFKLAFGVSGLKGLLSKAQAATMPVAPRLGAVVTVAVQAVNAAAGTVRCSALAAEALDNEQLKLESLKAGFLVRARVDKILPTMASAAGQDNGGAVLKFCGALTGMVHPHHLGAHASSSSGGKKKSQQEPVLQRKQVITARVLAVVPGEQVTVHLTLMPHLLDWKSLTAKSMPAGIGNFIDGEVIDVLPKYGCRMQCAIEPSDGGAETAKAIEVPGFCPTGRMADKEALDTSKEALSVGEKVRCRVLGHNFLDGTVILTRRPYDLREDTLVSLSELTPGQFVIGTITRLAEFGVFVKLSEYVSGMVSLRHLTDVPLASVPKKYQLGLKMKCRVLKVNAERRQVNLTAKKTLVKDEFQLSEFNQARKDMLVTGYVGKVADYGAIVNFYGEMIGLIPAKEMELDEAPALGMAVRCRISQVNRKRERIGLSLDLENGKAPSEFPADGSALGELEAAPEAGDEITEVYATRAIEMGLYITFKCKRTEEQQRSGFVLMEHTSDNVDQAKARLAAIAAELKKAGDSDPKVLVGGGVVIARRYFVRGEEEAKDHTFYSLVSLKPSMVLAAKEGNFVSDLHSLEKGKLYSGYIKEVHDFGVFVSLGFWKFCGLAPKHQLAEHFVEKPSQEFKPGQTVRAMVSKIDEEKQRFAVDLRPASPSPADAALLRREAIALQRYFEWQAALATSAPSKPWTSLLPGTVVDAEISALQPYGLLLTLPAYKGLTAVALKENCPDKMPKEGETVRCAVLDFDAEKKIVDASLLPELVGAAAGASLLALQEKLQETRPSKRKRKAKAETTEAEEEGTEGAPAPQSQVMVMPALQKSAYSVLWCKEPPAVLFVPPMEQRRWTAPRPAVLHSVPDAQGVFSRVIARCPTGGPSRSTKLPSIMNPKQELQVGSPIILRVLSMKGQSVTVIAPVGIRGCIHATQFVDSGALGVNFGKPLDRLTKGGVIEARMLRMKEYGMSKRGGQQWFLELTCRPSLMNAPEASAYEAALPKWKRLKVGMQMPVVVCAIQKNYLWVEVSPDIKGRINRLDLSKDVSVVKEIAKHFEVGQVLMAQVLAVKSTARKLTRLDMTLTGEGAKNPPGPGPSLARMLSVHEPPERGVAAMFRLPGKRKGAVHITELFDFWAQFPLKRLKAGELQEVVVLDRTKDKGNVRNNQAADTGTVKIPVSMRGSKVFGQAEGKEERRPDKFSDLKVGQKVNGYVVNSGPKGVFVALSRTVVARIKLRALAEKQVDKDAVARLYPVGHLVREALVWEIDESANRAELSLKPGLLNQLKLEQLSVGDVVRGRVKAVEKYGLFVRLENSSIEGLVHKTQISDNASVSLESFPQGTLLKRVKVTKIEGKKVWFGIKPSLFDGDEGLDDEDDEEEPEEEEADAIEAEKPAEENEEPEERPKKSAKTGKKASATEEAAASSPKAKAKPAAVAPKPAESEDEEVPWVQASAASASGAGAAFEWADFTAGQMSASEDEQAEDADDNDDEGEAKRPTKRQKKAAKIAEAQELQRREVENADGRWSADPRSIEDFERLLLTEGSTSIVWIRYMAFHLKMSDLEKARQVAERAVKHVGFSESRERFNVWVAFMNLECTFGTDQSAEAVFKRAAAHNDAREVHMQLARIHERNKKPELAVKVFEVCCRKFNQSKKVWLAFLAFLYAQGDLEGARKKLPNCLAAVPRWKHPMVVSKAALLEYQYGSAERGRSIFEGLLDSYPKRTDLWSVYLDAHIKAFTPPKVPKADLREVRSILERCCSMKLKVTKMRFFFKRWLDFEKRWGDAESQEKVRARARNFVEQQAS